MQLLPPPQASAKAQLCSAKTSRRSGGSQAACDTHLYTSPCETGMNHKPCNKMILAFVYMQKKKKKSSIIRYGSTWPFWFNLTFLKHSKLGSASRVYLTCSFLASSTGLVCMKGWGSIKPSASAGLWSLWLFGKSRSAWRDARALQCCDLDAESC